MAYLRHVFYLQRILVKSKNILLLIVSNILVIAKKKKTFSNNEKEGLFDLMLELNNL